MRRTLAIRLRDRRGFTLVELLIVITIITLLIAMLLPALRQSREGAIKVTCQSQLHQIGIVNAGYASDYKSHMMQSRGDGLIAALNRGAKRYFDPAANSEKRILFCPNIPTDASGFQPSEWDEPGIVGGPGYYRIGYMWTADPETATASYWIDANGNGSLRDEYVLKLEDAHAVNTALCVDWSRKRLSAGWQFRHAVGPAGGTNELLGDGRVIDKPAAQIVDRWYPLDPLGW